MALAASCPRCASPVTVESSGSGDLEEGFDPARIAAVNCLVHGSVIPLWRPIEVGYDSYAELVTLAGEHPTYLPWPMSPGWRISDIGVVAERGRPYATVTTTCGVSDVDGAVEVTIVSEELGVGLGSRCSGSEIDPGLQIEDGPHDVEVRAGGMGVRLWAIDAGSRDEVLARSVFAGVAGGRWLWLVVRPASAALLLRDPWLLADVTGFGPEALEMPFGGERPLW